MTLMMGWIRESDSVSQQPPSLSLIGRRIGDGVKHIFRSELLKGSATLSLSTRSATCSRHRRSSSGWLPPRPGRHTHRAQVKAAGPQVPEDCPEPEEPVSTFTPVNPRAALAEPHSGQRGAKPWE